MAAIALAKDLKPTFGNEKQVARTVYDFASDGGVIGALDIFTAKRKLVISRILVNVLTPVTATGSATVAFGKTGTATAFIDTTAGAKANYADGKVLGSSSPAKMAIGDAIIMTIGTDALLTGKLEIIVEYYLAN